MDDKEIKKRIKELKEAQEKIDVNNILVCLSLDIANKYCDLLKENYDLQQTIEKQERILTNND